MTMQESVGYSRYLLAGVFSVFLTTAYAQETMPDSVQGESVAEQPREPIRDRASVTIDSINIVRDYRPMLADAVKVRRTPNMGLDREKIEAEVRRIAAATYFEKNAYKKPYYGKLLERHPDASSRNINNFRIGYLAYQNHETERARDILGKIRDSDAFYQAALIGLGNIWLETGNRQQARETFVEASGLDFDEGLKADALFDYAKLLYEQDSTEAALEVALQYIDLVKVDLAPGTNGKESQESLLAKILAGTSNFEAAVNMLEAFKNRDQEADLLYQKVAYFRGLEFYNERAFENSISLFMRSEDFPIDPRIAALATYWKAEAMYEVRKYGEAVQSFTRFLGMSAAPGTDVYIYANYALAYAAFRSNNFGTAARYFAHFVATGSSSMDDEVLHDAIARLGDSYLSLRDYEQANACYDRLIAAGASNQDYALFQRGIIQGLQGNYETKLETLHAVVEQFPGSSYADDVAFEIPYTYFLMGDYETAIDGLQRMIEQYPRSSYTPRALMTIGLVQYNKEDTQSALSTFRRVVEQHPTTDEAHQALRAIENIYMENGDASGYVSPAEQDNLSFQAANTVFGRGDYQAAVEAVNAYFDKFPRPGQEKHARYIRGVSLYRTGHPEEALHDLNMILNDWTSQYTENTLLVVADLYLGLKQYNEAIVHLKKLEITTSNKKNYGFAINSLMVCYNEIGDSEQVMRYAKLIQLNGGSSEEEVARAHLYTGHALLRAGNAVEGEKQMNLAALKSQTEIGAEGQYYVAQLQYEAKAYDEAIASAFDVINNRSEYDYWVAKCFIVLADAYAGKGDSVQAKSTLESVIENYGNDDDGMIVSAKERLKKLNNISNGN